MAKDQHAGMGGSYEMIGGVRVLRQRTDMPGTRNPEFGIPGSKSRIPKERRPPPDTQSAISDPNSDKPGE